MNFASERELAETFCKLVNPDIWVVYPETGNFDLLLSRKLDGFQIGIEAKLQLNPKVIIQAADLAVSGRGALQPGPDCRAILIPWAKRRREESDYASIIRALQIQVLRVSGRRETPYLSMTLPDTPNHHSAWPEHFPSARIALPDYIPDVAAGVKSPVRLTDWKIKAIKLEILLSKRGYLVRNDFVRLGISPSTWTQRGWVVPSQIRGQWVIGSGIPDFKAQHPVNYVEIENDYSKWNRLDLEGVI